MRAFGSDGQMSVEVAVLVPVAIVVALSVYNIGRFLELCAVFDRASFDAVASLGVSPAGEQSVWSSVEQVRACIEQAVGNTDACEVTVGVDGVVDAQASSTFALGPSLVRYTCSLVYRPWPSRLVLAGVSMGSPLALHHERSLSVDRFRPGVVV